MIPILSLSFGLPLAILIFIVYQILKDPSKAVHYKALFLSPFYKIGKWGAKSYIGAKVSYQVNEFFNRYLFRNVATHEDITISIKWIESPEDPILREGNAVIICLKKSNDQAKNILNAAEEALPIISHPHLRANIDKYIEKSIDLVTLKKLGDLIGRHGSFTHKKYFLEPSTKEDERIAACFQKLVEIDNRGYFVSIFLNELEFVSDGIYASADFKNRTSEVIDFIEYLIKIARIEVGDEVTQWHYVSEMFSCAIILMANNQRMIRQGLKPYMDRINKNLKQGLESIYILSEENSWDFLKRYEEALSGNDRVTISGRYQVNGIVQNDSRRKSAVKIILLRKIDILADDLFKEKLNASNIEIGSIISGEVTDVSEELAIVTIAGMDGFIKTNQCSWSKISSCSEILKVGEKLDFIVKSINENKMSIELSLLFEERDPWKIIPQLKIGDECEVNIYFQNNSHFYCRDETGRLSLLPVQEISWQDISTEEKNSYLHKSVKVRVIEVNNESKEIITSIRRFEEDPWPEINRQIKPNTDYMGKVIEVTDFFVKVEILPGIIGVIPKERLLEAGGVFVDFKNNIVKAQGIDVYVTRVFVSKKKIHLDLKQNKEKYLNALKAPNSRQK